MKVNYYNNEERQLVEVGDVVSIGEETYLICTLDGKFYAMNFNGRSIIRAKVDRLLDLADVIHIYSKDKDLEVRVYSKREYAMEMKSLLKL